LLNTLPPHLANGVKSIAFSRVATKSLPSSNPYAGGMHQGRISILSCLFPACLRPGHQEKAHYQVADRLSCPRSADTALTSNISPTNMLNMQIEQRESSRKKLSCYYTASRKVTASCYTQPAKHSACAALTGRFCFRVIRQNHYVHLESKRQEQNAHL